MLLTSLAHIAKTSGLLQDLYTDKTVEGISRYENIQELLNGIKEFTERTFEADKDPIEQEWVTIDGEVLNEKQLDHSLGAYLQEISLLTDFDKDSNSSEDRVKLMTIHSAKGLEFPCVYVVGLEENLFPNTMNMSSREEMEEERRLFYVAITRARHKLTLSFAQTRYRFGNHQYNEPSRFLDEIDPAVLDMAYVHHGLNASSREEKFSKVTIPIRREPQYNHKPSSDFAADDYNLIQTGMEVEHQRFGIGKVIHLEGNSKDKMATIFFQQEVGQKKIMLRYAKLRIVNRQISLE